MVVKNNRSQNLEASQNGSNKAPVIHVSKVHSELVKPNEVRKKIREPKEVELIKMKEEFARELEIKVTERTAELDAIRLGLVLSLSKEKEMNEMKSRFVGTVSHELRTPLTVILSIMGVLEIQSAELSGDFKLKFERSSGRIKNQIRRMTSLMDNLLILCKLSARHVVINKEPVNLVNLCNEISRNYNDIQLDGRKVEFSQEGNAYEVNVDSKLLEHAISNLVSNALKYSEGSAQSPSIRLTFTPDEVKIVVEDDGIGIPEKDLACLFEPFYRASNAADFSGTGLGSSIAKEYIELIGGALTVRSEVSVGSEFTIVLMPN